jgi:predicted nucleic acid-binding protein
VIVADASAIVQACLSEADLDALVKLELVGPPLLWSEVTSALHELGWRREITRELERLATERFGRLRIAMRRTRHLYGEARHLADRLGWAKTYDAEYVALARLLRCQLLTVDSKLAAATRDYVEAMGPVEVGLH